MAAFGSVTVCASLHFLRLTLHFRKCREFLPETGSRATGSSASYYVLDIAYIIVFLGSLFCREFAGFTGLVSKAIRGRDGFTRDFGCGRYENLSGAISWLTFFAGGAAEARRRQTDWRRELVRKWRFVLSGSRVTSAVLPN